MTALIIILIIISFFVWFFSRNIFFYLSFDNELKFKIRFLFYKIDSSKITEKEKKSKKLKKKKLSKEKKEKPKKESKFKLQEIIKHRDVSGFLYLLKSLVSICTKSVLKLLKSLKVDEFHLSIIISEDDAAKTALNYGKICAIVYPSTSFLIQNFKISNPTVKVNANFNEEKGSKVRFNLKFHITLFSVLRIALYAILRYIKTIVKVRD